MPRDENTPVTCLACGGHWLVENGEPRVCPWCTRGLMNESQFARWQERRPGGPRR